MGGQRELGRAQLHVVPPARLGVEGVGERGHERVRRVGGGRHGVEHPGLTQLAPGARPVVAGVGLRREREGGDDPADQVGADRVAGRRGGEERAVRDEAVAVGLVAVVGLGEPPQVVVAVEGAGAVAGADPDLEVEGAGPGVPHLAEPVQPVAGLGRERRGCPTAQEAGAGEEQDVVVRRRVRELEVVTGVEPATLHVDLPPGEGMEPTVGDQVGAGRHVGPAVHGRVPVVQVGRPAVQPAADDVPTVALGLVEGDAGVQDRPEQPPGAGHLEPRRGGLQGARAHDPVAARPVEAAEVEAVDVGVGLVPGPGGRVRHAAAEDDVSGAVGHLEGAVPDGLGSHQRGPLGLLREIALLVDTDLRRGRGRERRARAVDRGVGRAGQTRSRRQGHSECGAAGSCHQSLSCRSCHGSP